MVCDRYIYILLIYIYVYMFLLYIIYIIYIYIYIYIIFIIYIIYVDTGIYEPTNKQTKNTLKESNSGSPALADRRPTSQVSISVVFPRNPFGFFPSKCVPHYLSTLETSSR